MYYEFLHSLYTRLFKRYIDIASSLPNYLVSTQTPHTLKEVPRAPLEALTAQNPV